MKITEDLRKYAAGRGVSGEKTLSRTMESTLKEFADENAEVYAYA